MRGHGLRALIKEVLLEPRLHMWDAQNGCSCCYFGNYSLLLCGAQPGIRLMQEDSRVIHSWGKEAEGKDRGFPPATEIQALFPCLMLHLMMTGKKRKRLHSLAGGHLL